MYGKHITCYGLVLLLAVAATSACRRVKSTSDLIDDLRNSPRLQVQAAAARALGERKDARAVPPLIVALRGLQPIRISAAQALGSLKDARAVDPLIGVLKEDLNPLVRVAAAQALGELRDSRAVDPLVTALAADNEAAGPALAKIGPPAIAPLIACLREVQTRDAAANALIQIGKPSVEPVVAAVTTYTDDARASAARILAEIDDPRGNQALRSVLRGGDLRLGAAAYKFLIRTRAPEDQALLLKALHTYGRVEMAEDLVHSGRPELQQAAQNWARQNRYNLGILEPVNANERSLPR